MKKKRPEKIPSVLKRVRDCIETGRYRETAHASYRKYQRKIVLPDILDVLYNGRHEKRKDQYDEEHGAWNYAVRGKTVIDDDMQVIVSFDKVRDLIIITAFYIEDGK